MTMAPTARIAKEQLSAIFRKGEVMRKQVMIMTNVTKKITVVHVAWPGMR